MEGQANLYVIIYKLDSPNSDANLIDWFIVGNDKKIAYLRRADEKVMGMTPALQGTDVIPGKDEAEIIVRWTNPWMGGGRTVQKFSYCSKGLVLLAEAEYLGRPEMKWRRVVEDVGEAAPLAHDK